MLASFNLVNTKTFIFHHYTMLFYYTQETQETQCYYKKKCPRKNTYYCILHNLQNYFHQPRLINSHIRYLSFYELFFYFSKVIQVIYMWCKVSQKKWRGVQELPLESVWILIVTQKRVIHVYHRINMVIWQHSDLYRAHQYIYIYIHVWYVWYSNIPK